MIEQKSNLRFPLSIIENFLAQRRRINYERRLLQSLEILPEAKDTLREILSRPNPHSAEIHFIGVGANNIVEKIYASRAFSSSSKIRVDGRIISSSTDPSEMQLLVDEIKADGRDSEIILFGHTHPPIVERDSILSPSRGDLEAVRSEKGNPTLIDPPFEAIASAPYYGPAVRIYLREDLARARSNLDWFSLKNKSKTILL